MTLILPRLCCPACVKHDWVDHEEGAETTMDGGAKFGCPLKKFKYKVMSLSRGALGSWSDAGRGPRKS